MNHLLSQQPSRAPLDGAARLPGLLVTLDGPGGAGKSTTTRLVVETLLRSGVPVHAASQPSRAPLGELARHGTDTYRGMALACLCAADRHHQLAVEILPALTAGRIVVCDRYVASSLVLQGLDGVPSHVVWQLNEGVYRPDLSIILTGDPQVIETRLGARGAHSRFERAADDADREVGRYLHAVADLQGRGWPVVTLDATADAPDVVADGIVSLIRQTQTERSRPTCP